MDIWFTVAGGIAVFWTGVHIFLGGPEIAHPLLASDLKPMVKYVNYYCWHLVSISIAVMALLFLWPGVWGGPKELAVVGTVLATGFSIWGIVLAPRAGVSYKVVPQGWFFAPIAALGIIGLF